MLGVGNYSAPPCTPIIHPEPPHTFPHQHIPPPPPPYFNESVLDNQQIRPIPHCPYDITSKLDGTPYDPWPDGWGHSPTEITDDTLRLFLKNPNGIIPSPGKVCPKLMHGLQSMADLGAGIILLNETNCDVKRSDVRDTYKTHLDKHWLHSRTEFTCSSIKPQNSYLPGGSLISILGHWTGRVINTEVDPTNMGRWTCCNMRGKQ